MNKKLKILLECLIVLSLLLFALPIYFIAYCLIRYTRINGLLKDKFKYLRP